MTNFDPMLPPSAELTIDGQVFSYQPISTIPDVDRLPVSLRILLENVLRRVSDPARRALCAQRVIEAGLKGMAGEEIEFMPARVLFQDFTGVPVFVDFAAMRDAAIARGGDASAINPQIPCVLVIDHSVTADVVSCASAAAENARIEAERNAERFAFLKWSSNHFSNVEIVPPGVGICHQLNIERFCDVVHTRDGGGAPDTLYFDTLVGTDSHTTTANGMGVLGWGVGGIEAEAAALGQAITMTVPSVVGLHMTGRPQPGVTAMDIALTLAQKLRSRGVVGSIVECFGEGARALTVTQRATIANMSPEYGCTATLFPPDANTLAQLDDLGRPERTRRVAEAYLGAQGVMDADPARMVFCDVMELDLDAVRPSISGPSRPHDRFDVATLPKRFSDELARHGRSAGETFEAHLHGGDVSVSHGAIAIAAITSCTTATDPEMMIAAGMVAKRAQELGLTLHPWTKCVFAPGSHATTELLSRAGLLQALEGIGFATCGWGCMSCIGNSGPLERGMHGIAGSCELVSVLSGNRNFEGRISPDVSQNYLCAPALVVAFALAGTVDIDLTREPIATTEAGAVFLADLMPNPAELAETVRRFVTPDAYAVGARALPPSDAWDNLAVQAGDVFSWDVDSTYVRRPTFLDGVTSNSRVSISGARVLAKLGDFITTDHISPAGSIPEDSPAASYLREHGVDDAAFNSYGSRRGNHEVMMRGTFGNVKLQNELTPHRLGGWTVDPVTGDETTVFEASCSARAADVPLIVLAGKMYGSGSSRDWAAKGPALLGVRAVIAESFERIHRSNLIGMGILPLEFEPGENAATLCLTGHETFDIDPIDFSDGLPTPAQVRVTARDEKGVSSQFLVKVRVDTPTEGGYIEHGGILTYVLDDLLS